MGNTSRFSWVARRIAVTVLVQSLAGPALLVAQSKAAPGERQESTSASAQGNQVAGAAASSCVIVKHKGTVGRRLIFTALIGVPIAPGAKYDLVDSVNYHAEKVAFKGKELEKLQSGGVPVIVLDKKYTLGDVEAARKTCGEPTTQAQKH